MLSELYDVITVQDAAWLWGYTPQAIDWHLRRKRILARKSGGRWLISYRSLVRELGKPIRSLNDLQSLSEE